MRDMRTTQDYLSILTCFYLYFGALEQRINLFIGKDELPDYRQRRKTQSLVNDIKWLKGAAPAFDQSISVPEITNSLQAYGALYVLEGSTLGGKIISKMISKQLGVDDQAITFFKSYGDNLEVMWNLFTANLNLQARNEADEDVVINAANETFIRFKDIFEENR